MKIDADLNPFEARVLYRVLWALQGSIDTMAAKAILCKTIRGLRVTLSEEEAVQSGHALADIIRKFGLVPGSVEEDPLFITLPLRAVTGPGIANVNAIESPKDSNEDRS